MKMYWQDASNNTHYQHAVLKYKQAGAELGQAQVKLDDIVVVVFKVVVKAMVEVEFQLLFRVDGGWVVGGRIKRN